MARKRGTGNLQQEKNGTWTLRVGWKGRRLSRSTGTTDRARAEKALAKFLVPLGGGKRQGVVFALCSPQQDRAYKPILAVLDKEPIFTEEMLLLARFLKDRTFCTFFEAARAQLPTGFHLKTTATYLALQTDKNH